MAAFGFFRYNVFMISMLAVGLFGAAKYWFAYRQEPPTLRAEAVSQLVEINYPMSQRKWTFLRTVFYLMLPMALAVQGICLTTSRTKPASYSMTKPHDDYIATYDALDPRLLQHIREYYLSPPAKKEALRLDHPEVKDQSISLSAELVGKVLHGKRNGFFIEAGAYDGEAFSNTIYLETQLDWTGLLVEGDPESYHMLLSKKRSSWVVRGCLTAGNRPVKVKFNSARLVSGIQDDAGQEVRTLNSLWMSSGSTDVWCFPLSSLLAAINVTYVDYASIDVEAATYDVIKDMPWKIVRFDLVQIEYMQSTGAMFNRAKSTLEHDRMMELVHSLEPPYQHLVDVGLDMIIKRKDLIVAPGVVK